MADFSEFSNVEIYSDSPDIPTWDNSVIENPIPQNRVGMPEDIHNLVTTQAAYVKSNNEETHLFEAFATIGEDAKSERQQALSVKVEKDRQEIAQAFIDNPGTTQDESDVRYQATQSLTNDLNEQLANPHKGFVNTVSQGRISPEQEKDISAQLGLLEMMSDVWEGMSKPEVVWEAGKMLIPGNMVYDNLNLSGSISAEDYLRNLVSQYKNLPAKDQLDMQPVIKDILTEGLGNKIKVLTVFDAMFKPGGEEDLSDFNAIWASLDIANVGLLGISIGTRLAKLRKKWNAVSTINAAGDSKTATDINAGAIISEDVAKLANVDKETAVTNATGLDGSVIDIASTGGLSQSTLRSLKAFEDNTKAMQAEVGTEQAFIKEGLLDKFDRVAAEQKVINDLEKQPAIENIKVTNRTGTTVEFSYDTKDATGKLIPNKYQMQLTLNDAGYYEQNSVGIISSLITSPNVWLKGDAKPLVEAAIRLDSAESKLLDDLISLNTEALKSVLGPAGLKGLTPSGRASLARVDSVLRSGDYDKTVYSPLELSAGVNGVPLDAKEIEAYYKMRMVQDNFYRIGDMTKKAEYGVKGYKHVHLNETASIIAKPYSDANSARLVLAQGKGKMIWDQAKMEFKSVSNFSTDELVSAYNSGKVLVRFDKPTEMTTATGQGEKVYYALVNSKNIGELPQTVTPYRVGYMTKITPYATYFVKEFSKDRVDGVDIPATDPNAMVTTIRQFDNKRDADKFAAAIKAKNPGNRYRVLEDRQLEQEARIGASRQGLGGLYTGFRAEEDIPFGLDGLPPERANSFEATTRNAARLAKYVSRNDWRLGVEQKALNTANEIIPGANFQHFSELGKLGNTEAERFIKKLHGQIEEWVGFPTKEEQLWGALVQRTVDTLNPILPGVVKHGILNTKHKDPVAAARAITFKSLLGFWNPSQIWIQGQALSVAASSNMFKPIELAKMGELIPIMAILESNSSYSMLKHVSKVTDMTPDELLEMTALFNKSGLKQSILKNGDYVAESMGRGIAMDAIKRASDAGLLLYTRTELFNRRGSFITAFRQWKEANKGAKVTADAEKAILTKTNSYLLNMSKANRAWWQKGILGVGTQFLQPTTKGFETIIGLNKALSPSERGKLMTSQVLLYGAAGVPLGGYALTMAAETLGLRQVDLQKEENRETIKTLNEGFIGWATLAMLGVDIEIGQRSSLLSGINQLVDKFMFDDATTAQMFLGAFSVPSSRFFDAMMKIYKPISLGAAEVTNIEATDVAKLLVSPISTWKNTSKALFMHNFHLTKTRSGKVLVQKDYTDAEEIAVAIGFTLGQEARVWRLEDIKKAEVDLRTDLTNTIVNIIWDYSIKVKDKEVTKEYSDKVSKKIALLEQSLATNYERQLLRDAIKERMTNGNSMEEKAWREFRQIWNNGSVDTLIGMHNKLRAEGLLVDTRNLTQETE